MALEGLLALLSGGMSGYAQGRQDHWARLAARNPAKTTGTVPSGDDLVADFDRRVAAIQQRDRQRYQQPFGSARYYWQQPWSKRYPLLPEGNDDNPFGL